MTKNINENKQTWGKRLGEKFKKQKKPDVLMNQTLNELTEIVGSMRDIFNEFDESYDAQLDEERSLWDRMQAKMPSVFQLSENVKNEEKRKKRIKMNKHHLDELHDNLNKLDIVLNNSSTNFQDLEEDYIDAISSKNNNLDKKNVYEKINTMETNMAEAVQQLSGQIRLIKSAMDNMAGQLDEQGVKLEGIDGKIDVIDTKLDHAQELIRKVSKQITNGRLLFLFGALTIAGIAVTSMVSG